MYSVFFSVLFFAVFPSRLLGHLSWRKGSPSFSCPSLMSLPPRWWKVPAFPLSVSALTRLSDKSYLWMSCWWTLYSLLTEVWFPGCVTKTILGLEGLRPRGPCLVPSEKLIGDSDITKFGVLRGAEIHSCQLFRRFVCAYTLFVLQGQIFLHVRLYTIKADLQLACNFA